jgi:hypothetical protein
MARPTPRAEPMSRPPPWETGYSGGGGGWVRVRKRVGAVARGGAAGGGGSGAAYIGSGSGSGSSNSNRSECSVRFTSRAPMRVSSSPKAASSAKSSSSQSVPWSRQRGERGARVDQAPRSSPLSSSSWSPAKMRGTSPVGGSAQCCISGGSPATGGRGTCVGSTDSGRGNR